MRTVKFEPVKPARFVIEVHTDDFRGDHAADIVIALEQKAHEPIEALVDRALRDAGPGDFIVIRRTHSVELGS